jgi:uncharacterized protein DUF3467
MSVSTSKILATSNGDTPTTSEVGDNALEFVLDFGQFYPDAKKVQLHTRIITSPIYAKELLQLLQESIDRYQQTVGPIREERKGEPG